MRRKTEYIRIVAHYNNGIEDRIDVFYSWESWFQATFSPLSRVYTMTVEENGKVRTRVFKEED